jgi:hypothetical protein
MYIFRTFPAVFLSAITFPLYLELKLSTSQTAVQYLLNHILFTTANNYRRWRRLGTMTWDGIQWCRCELDHIEHGVKATHGAGKAKAICIRTSLSFNHEWAKIAMRQLPGGARCGDVAPIKENTISRLEHRCWSASLIVISRHVVFRLR